MTSTTTVKQPLVRYEGVYLPLAPENIARLREMGLDPFDRLVLKQIADCVIDESALMSWGEAAELAHTCHIESGEARLSDAPGWEHQPYHNAYIYAAVKREEEDLP